MVIFALFISLAALGISIFHFWVDRSILRILEVKPGLSGSRSGDQKISKIRITSICVIVYNMGRKDAIDIEGLVTFGELDSLPLYPTDKGYVYTVSKRFGILYRDKKSLEAAWEFSGNDPHTPRAIAGPGIDKNEFLKKAPPITVKLFYKRKSITKVLTRKHIEKYIRKFEAQSYLSS